VLLRSYSEYPSVAPVLEGGKIAASRTAITLLLASSGNPLTLSALAIQQPESAVSWSARGQRRGRIPCTGGVRCMCLRNSELCASSKIELLKRVSPVRIRPGAQSVCAGQRL
jgi:hypothetical protein